MLFSDQVSILSTWFKNWNECEQTVALFSLLKRVHKRQAKFLARCLEHGLKDCLELVPVEREANDAGFIGRLINEPQQENIIKILLSHLPLLRPGNNDAKTRYLDLLPKVLAFAVESSEYLQESRQLLSYSLIHPAFDNDERSSLTSWMEHLDDRIPNVVPENNYPTDSQLEDTQNTNDVNHNRLWKDDPALLRPSDTSATPGLTSPTPWQPTDGQNFKTETNSSNSLSPGYRREENDSHRQTDSSKSTTEEANAAEYDFNPWLKSLRLHKYNDLFASMKYDEMMQLNEETLAKKNVTKGARDKILLNVRRLHGRFEKLQGLEKEIPGGGSMRNALNELKSMIYTPIIRFEPPPPTEDPTPAQAQNLPTPSPNEILPGDIPGQFTKVLGKACTQLLISKPDKDNITLYLQLLEKCMHHMAFTPQQKKRLQSWKCQMNKIYRSLPRNQQMSSQRKQLEHSEDLKKSKSLSPCHIRPNGSAVGGSYPNKRVSGRSLPSFQAGVISATSPAIRSSNQLSMFPALKPTWYGGGYGSNTHPTPHTVQPPIEAARKTASLDPSLVQRPTAYPVSHPADVSTTPGSVIGPVDTDISNRLDSLSLSVAEHALSDADRVSTL